MNIDFESYKPKIVDRYKSMVTYQFNHIKEALGPECKGASMHHRYFKMWNETVRPNVKRINIDRFCIGGEYVIDEEKLNINATQYAEETLEAWEYKINSKLIGTTDLEVKYLDGFRFVITGKRDNNKISIEQDMIVNVSSRGKLFNQYPSRIYIDGKFISEAKYKNKA